MCTMDLHGGPNHKAELSGAFEIFDEDGNGFITRTDLHHALTQMGSDKLSSDEADSLLKLVDKDGDGLINYEEFTKLILGNGSPSPGRIVFDH